MIRYLLQTIIGIGLMGCLSTSKIEKVEVNLPQNKLPENYAISLSGADSCAVIIDTDKLDVVGTIKHPHFKRSSDLTLTSAQKIYIPQHADGERPYRAVSILDMKQMSIVGEIDTAVAPAQIASDGAKYVVVSHNQIKPSLNYDIAIIDQSTSKLKATLEVPGFVTDIGILGDKAYLLVAGEDSKTRHGIHELNLINAKLERFIELKDTPLKMKISEYHLGELYIILNPPNLSETYCYAGRKTELISVNIKTGISKSITTLSDGDAIAEISKDSLFVSETCGDQGTHVRQVNPQTGKIGIDKSFMSNPVAITKLNDDISLLTLEKSSEFVFVNNKNLNEIKRLKSPCMWPNDTTLKP